MQDCAGFGYNFAHKYSIVFVKQQQYGSLLKMVEVCTSAHSNYSSSPTKHCSIHIIQAWGPIWIMEQ